MIMILILLISIILIIIILISYHIRQEKNYILNEIESFINNDYYTIAEIEKIKKLFLKYNKALDCNYKILKKDEENIINNIKKIKIFLVHKSLVDLENKWINKDLYKIIDFLEEKYSLYLYNEKNNLIYNKEYFEVSKIIYNFDPINENYKKSIHKFYKFIFWYNNDIIESISIMSQYRSNNIIDKLKVENNEKIIKLL